MANFSSPMRSSRSQHRPRVRSGCHAHTDRGLASSRGSPGHWLQVARPSAVLLSATSFSRAGIADASASQHFKVAFAVKSIPGPLADTSVPSRLLRCRSLLELLVGKTSPPCSPARESRCPRSGSCRRFAPGLRNRASVPASILRRISLRIRYRGNCFRSLHRHHRSRHRTIAIAGGPENLRNQTSHHRPACPLYGRLSKREVAFKIQ